VHKHDTEPASPYDREADGRTNGVTDSKCS